MKLNEKYVISINRELGSGGRTVGEKLAQRLGVVFYDKALIKALTKQYNLTVEEIERLKGKNTSWWRDFARHIIPFYDASKSEYYRVTSEDTTGKPLTTEEMFKVETRILTDIASNESCVVAGRSGFFIFRNIPNHLSILIQAPMKNRIERVMRKQGKNATDAQKLIEQVDRMRENYINRYTGTSRYNTRNYDLVINMVDLTEDEAVDIIMDYIGKQQ